MGLKCRGSLSSQLDESDSQETFLAKVNDLNLFHTEDDFSSVNCESTIIIVTKSDIVRGKMDKH